MHAFFMQTALITIFQELGIELDQAGRIPVDSRFATKIPKYVNLNCDNYVAY